MGTSFPIGAWCTHYFYGDDIMHFLKKIFNRPSLGLVVAHLDESSMYNMEWEALSQIKTEVKDSCLTVDCQVTAKPMFDDIDPVSISFEYCFLVPFNKRYNPANGVAMNFNTFPNKNILVKELKYNSNKSRLYELDCNQLVMVQHFCQRILKQYYLDNVAVYQHSLEALCANKEWTFSHPLINLKVSRYSVVNSDWRVFMYRRCNSLFSQNTAKKKSKAANDKNYKNGFTDIKFGAHPAL